MVCLDKDGRNAAILFDKDGTLFDFRATWCVWADGFLNRLSGGDAARASKLGGLIGFDIHSQQFSSQSVAIAGTPDEIAAALLPALPGWTAAHLTDRINSEAALAPLVEAVPLRPLLERLRGAGHFLGVATNDAEAAAEAHLRAAGVRGLFDIVFGSDSGAGAKPGPGQLLAFAEATGCAPQDVVMVGDSPHDLLAARAAGMRAVAVLTGLATEAELHPLADAVLPDIGHLPEWLGLESG